MLVFMLVAHLRFTEVPRQLSFNQLFEMARICDRYDVNDVLDPFIPVWIGLHRSASSEMVYEQWLYIAHQFGMEAGYIQLAKYLVANCRINIKKQLLLPESGRVLTGDYLEGCLGKYTSYGRMETR